MNYTIIIPHYNTPDLLQRCVDSIPQREDVEVIIVDDNSSPEVVDFENFPALHRPNTRIIFNKESHGAGHARNLALPHATGKWLLFADADDYFSPTAWDSYDKYVQSTADIVYFNIRSVDSETGEVLTDRGTSYIRNLMLYAQTGNDKYGNLLKFWNNTPWGKLIRHSLVQNNQILFDTTRNANDVIFSTKTAIAASFIEVCTDVCYYVTRHEGSLTQNRSMEAINERFEVALRKNQLLREAGNARFQPPTTTFLKQLSHFGWMGIRLFFVQSRRYGNSFLRDVWCSIWGRIEERCIRV